MRGDETRDDDELVAAVLAGDRDAFGALARRHMGLIVLVVRRYFPHGDTAVDHEDLYQEVLVRAFTRLATYRPTGRFGAWLSSVARNYCIDCGRRRHYTTIPHEALTPRADVGPGPEVAAIRRELGDTLAAAIAQLAPQRRGAVILCCEHELGMAEAGAVLGLPSGTVKTRLWRARQELRQALAGVA